MPVGREQATLPHDLPAIDIPAIDIRAAGCLFLSWTITTAFMWAFAFFHLPSASPEWLTRAQVACFGVDETGLPDTYGWMLLTLAPLSLLVALVTALGREMKLGLTKMKNISVGRLILAVLCLTVLAESIWIGDRIVTGLNARSINQAALNLESLPEGYPRLSKPAPTFQLVDQRGENISIEKFRGTPLLLTFAFAHCQTICPFIVKNSQEALGRQGVEGSQLVVVTLDPWRDTPGSLQTQATAWRFGEREHFVSGPIEDVNATLEKYGVPRQRDEKTGDIVHPALVYVIDPNGDIAYAFNNPSPQWLYEALRRVNE